MAMAAALLLLLLTVPVIYAANHTVGGSSGWTTGVNYTDWAVGETFTVGDNLIFTYDSTHSVDEVSKSSYDSCATSNPISSYTGGSNTIALTAAGPQYFLCPTAGHCSGGMQLAITVVASSASTPLSPPSNSSSPSPPPPPSNASSTPSPITVVSSGSTPSSPPSNSSSPSPPPPPSNASSTPSPSGASSKLCSMSHSIVGFVLGFGIMFASVA